MKKIKDRETYSFSIRYGNKNDRMLIEHLNEKINSGISMSSYIRSLIENDMIRSESNDSKECIDNYINSNDVNTILEAINKLYIYNDNNANTTKSLLSVIDAQNKVIEQLSKQWIWEKKVMF